MPERISKVAHEYAGRKLTVGELFECEQQHVDLLLALGRIEPDEGDPGYRARETITGTLHLNRKKHKAA